LAVALAPLQGLLDIQRVNLTANLAISSQGREAVSELARQTAELLNVRPMEPRFFDRQVAFNLLAQVGTPDAQGHTLLEKRLVRELREVLGQPLLKISVTCIQAPVFFGDSYSVTLQSARDVDLAAVNAALEAACRYLAYELGPRDIRVHAISPGPLQTRAASGLKDFDHLLSEAVARAPLGELVDIVDVGNTCAYLASPFAKRLTGSTVYVDGGLNIIA